MGEVREVELLYEQVVRGTSRVRVPYINEIPTASFRLNDFLVTVDSARMWPNLGVFKEIESRKNNHATVANPDTAEAVIEAIQTDHPLRSFPF